MAEKQTEKHVEKKTRTLEATGRYVALESVTYMPASMKNKITDDPAKNNELCVRHTLATKDPVTGKDYTEEERIAKNLIEDIDPDQAADLVNRGYLRQEMVTK